MYWCAADVGWVTGHSYIVYGPLSNGATTVMFEGVPTYPDSSCFWQVVDKHQVNILYTAPTAIRALMREGDAPVKRCSRKSCASRQRRRADQPRGVGMVLPRGRRRPLPDRRHVVATETGGIDHAAARRDEAQARPATRPPFGIRPAIVDANGKILEGGERNLVLLDSWPGQCARCTAITSASSTPISRPIPAHRRRRAPRRGRLLLIIGRVDDVINVAGHRLGTARSRALVADPKGPRPRSGFPHDLKGQGIYARVESRRGAERGAARSSRMGAQGDGAIATPDVIQWAPGLPKTRSARSCAESCARSRERHEQSGDTSTLADPAVVDDLIKNRAQPPA